MKNSEEMVNSLFERKERYDAEQKRKRSIATRTAISMCCVCLIALLGFGMWQGGLGTPTPSDQTVADALYPGIKDWFDESKGESPDNPAANNKIVINTIDSLSSGKMNISLMLDDRIEMSIEELCEYYGIDYIPDVPADIKMWPDQRGDIYRRNGGLGEAYWDANGLNFSNDDFTRSVHVAVDKGSYVLQEYLYFKGIEEKSVINNTEVLIGLAESGYYYSEFMYNGVGFLVAAEGLTEDEFVAVIASIIK